MPQIVTTTELYKAQFCSHFFGLHYGRLKLLQLLYHVPDLDLSGYTYYSRTSSLPWPPTILRASAFSSDPHSGMEGAGAPTTQTFSTNISLSKVLFISRSLIQLYTSQESTSVATVWLRSQTQRVPYML
jgi:hypothetical protein